jgi:SH3-like domain-containing protein
VNLRAGPSTKESILSVLSFGTPVFPQAREGNWVLVQVSGGPVGWIHRRLVGTRFSTESEAPAALRP